MCEDFVSVFPLQTKMPAESHVKKELPTCSPHSEPKMFKLEMYSIQFKLAVGLRFHTELWFLIL